MIKTLGLPFRRAKIQRTIAVRINKTLNNYVESTILRKHFIVKDSNPA